MVWNWRFGFIVRHTEYSLRGNEELTHITSAIAEMLLRVSADQRIKKDTTAPCQKP
jgi:hypothetical protein